jgi:hypothetical protein
MSPNRVVALLIPLAAPIAGWLTTWIAIHFPGLDIPQNALEEIFIAGALFALAPAAQWLHGWQKWETQQAQTEGAIQVAAVEAAADPPTVQVDIKQDEGLEDEEQGFEEDEDFDSSFGLDEFDDFDDDLLADEDPALIGS